jgi:hypothetical protein
VRLFDGEVKYIAGKAENLYMLQKEEMFKPNGSGNIFTNLKET